MRVAGVVVALGVLLVTACGGGEPEGAEESALTVAPSCTPGTVACTAEEAETQRLQAQMVESFWMQLREGDRIFAEGGVDEPTPVLKQSTSGPYLDFWMQHFRAWKERGNRTEGSRAARIRISSGPGKEGLDPRLVAEYCEDSSASMTITADGREVRDGTRVKGLLYGKVIEGRVKIVDADSDVVDSCE